MTLLGNRNRISALINLSWRYVAWSHGGGLIPGDDQPRGGEQAAGLAGGRCASGPAGAAGQPGAGGVR